MGDLVLGQQLRQGCAASRNRIFAALQLRRGPRGREMVSRILAGACQRHPSLVTIVRALRPGAAHLGDARDLFCLLRGDQRAKELLRRVAWRRQNRCELSLVSAMLSLLQQDRSLLACLLSFTEFKLNVTLDIVSRHQGFTAFQR